MLAANYHNILCKDLYSLYWIKESPPAFELF
uniref:Uncharacterized protein n=1 Tax=Anguilla anguilla TaxID=7936 RepID=A0A0E9RIC4_ANGAN